MDPRKTNKLKKMQKKLNSVLTIRQHGVGCSLTLNTKTQNKGKYGYQNTTKATKTKQKRFFARSR